MDTNKLQVKALTEKIEGKLFAVASEEVADRDGDIISIDGWELANFKKNPVLLWLHGYGGRDLPIGRAKSIGVKEIGGKKKLVFEPEFEDITDEGKTIARFYDEGWLKAWSVGFRPLESQRIGSDSDWNAPYKYLKQELLEISAVPIPALPSAVIMDNAKSWGLNMNVVKSFIDSMGKKDNKDEKTKEVETKKKEEVKEEKTVEKQGRVISAKNESKIKAAIASLQEVLSSLGEDKPTEDEEDENKKLYNKLEKIEDMVRHAIGETQAERKEIKKIEDKTVDTIVLEALGKLENILPQAIEKAIKVSNPTEKGDNAK
jgi:hypothetical protein